MKCLGNNCNVLWESPGNKCVKCSGIDCFEPDLEDPDNLVECESECYVGLDSNGYMERGCASDFLSTSDCATSSDEHKTCLICGEDNCNYILYPTANRLSCKICSSSDECLGFMDSVYCPRLHQDESCVTVFDSENKAAFRGCSSDLTTECEFLPDNCLNCNTVECNVQTAPNQTYTCMSCDSASDLNCVDNPSTKIGCSTEKCVTRLNGK